MTYRTNVNWEEEDKKPPTPRYFYRRDKVPTEVHPYKFGKWSCPACGVWRKPNWMCFDKLYGGGVLGPVMVTTASVEPDAKPVLPAVLGAQWFQVGIPYFQRKCSSCLFTWSVLTKMNSKEE